MSTIEKPPSTRTQSYRENSAGGEKPSRPLIIFNDDTCSLRYVDPPHGEESLQIPLRYLADSQVGALCWCMTSGESAYSWPSKVLENYYELLGAGRQIGLAEQGGAPVPESFFDGLAAGEDPKNVMVTLHRQGVDYLPKFIERTRRLGIKFYGSFRMNDCHHKSSPQGILTGEFWQEHQDWRLWEVLDADTYYNAALDYSYPEVRQRRREGIGETIQWYDMDGVELDFCRNCYTFPPSKGWEMREVFTDFLRQIRRDLDEAGEKWGRKLDLLIRVPFAERPRREAGMDVEAWLKEKLIDVLSMSCLLNDYNQSIEPWASRCREHNIGFYPSIEAGPAHNAIYNHVTRESVDEIVKRQRAAAQNFMGQGAAGVYMFNYPCHLFQWKRTPQEFDLLTDVMKEMGRMQTLAGKPRQYTFWTNLPMQVESRRPAQYHQTIHFSLFDSDLARADTNVQISFRQATKPNPHVDMRHFEQPQHILPAGWVTYWLNDKEVPESWIIRQPQPAGGIVSGFKLEEHEKIILTPPASAMKQGENTLGFFVPRFPQEHDPYIQIYELMVDVLPLNS